MVQAPGLTRKGLPGDNTSIGQWYLDVAKRRREISFSTLTPERSKGKFDGAEEKEILRNFSATLI